MVPAVAVPTDESRLAVRQRPSGRSLMYQSWIDLLFLHWKVDASTVQVLLPPGLYVDRFQGDAFVGVVPFFMKGIRFKYTPSIPGLSNFLELNLRTYVYDDTGVPGVWFFSLDCNQPLAVWAARTLFHLPYEHALMRARYRDNSSIEYSSTRRSLSRSRAESNSISRIDYALKSNRRGALPGSLEFFLVERYLLFSMNPSGQVLSGRVYHSPYTLCDVDVTRLETDLFGLNGLPVQSPQFDHAIGSRGVDVEVFQLESPSRAV
jgi:uncharacterized protein